MPSLGNTIARPLTEARPVQTGVVGLSLALLAAIAVIVWGQGWRQTALLGVAMLMGVTLYHAAFGFASAYRRLLLHGDVTLIIAQLIMLAVATVLFAPVLASGSVFGRGVIGAVAPAGWQVGIGALLFGIGMQLGGGCGSGTLFHLGSGSVRLLATLVFFIAGSFWASLHMGWWQTLPALPATALGDVLGWPLAVISQLGFLLLLGMMAWRWGSMASQSSPGTGWQMLLKGPWPLLFGASALALLNFLTLVLAGHPWSITWAFTLWGAKTAMLLGWDPAGSGFWSGGFQQSALAGGVLEDTTSVMDIGIVLGAMCASALAGRFTAGPVAPARTVLAAVLGGLAMGYGARIAFGCNIGAFFSGVASTSLHGWLWIAAAIPGTWLGVRLRPWFGLRN